MNSISFHEERGLHNPILLNTLGRVATLDKAAHAAGIPIDNFLSGIADEIKHKTGDTVEVDNLQGHGLPSSCHTHKSIAVL